MKIIRVKNKRKRSQEKICTVTRSERLLAGTTRGRNVTLNGIEQRKNLVLSKDTCVEKVRGRSIVISSKMGEGSKQRRRLNNNRCDWKINLMEINL